MTKSAKANARRSAEVNHEMKALQEAMNGIRSALGALVGVADGLEHCPDLLEHFLTIAVSGRQASGEEWGTDHDWTRWFRGEFAEAVNDFETIAESIDLDNLSVLSAEIN